MSTEALGYKKYKCPRCGWVHAAVPLQVARQNPEVTARYLRCFRCGESSSSFVPAETGDVPKGSTIQGVYVPGVWDDFFEGGPRVSDDFGDGIK